jgi:uncharacterized protein with NAD-binding domain and iron-sulfur cluster
VAVIGGGIAGMTAAHELIERGFDVTLCEAKSVPGGKARSFPVPGSGVGGRADLPGEHGFRFFPAFYRHLPDSMRRIPFAGNPNGVLDNLREVRHVHALGGGAGEVMLLPARAPESIADLSQWLGFFVRNDFGLPVQDRLRFAERMLILLTACEARRFRELEGLDWWRFIGADGASLKYQRTVAECSRLLVAARPRESSARTFGYVFLQLVLGMLQKGARADRVLCGPTSEVWILPWWEHLRSLGADLRTGARALTISMDNGRIDNISIEENGVRSAIKADDYVLALPLEAVRGLLTPAILEADPGLARLSKLKTAWMNGIQLYFDRDLRFVHGHTIYLGSPWSLVSIAQAQTWPGVDLSRRGDGSVRDILSVVISEWNAPGVLYGKPAARCSPLEIKAEVIAQIRAHLDAAARNIFDRARLVTWLLDPAIVHAEGGGIENLEPLPINTPGSWYARPKAATRIPNLFLASDYVRTFTDLPSMEAANEAARRAVNGILASSGSTARPCDLFPPELPLAGSLLERLDEERFADGRPHMLEGAFATRLG